MTFVNGTASSAVVPLLKSRHEIGLVAEPGIVPPSSDKTWLCHASMSLENLSLVNTNCGAALSRLRKLLSAG